MNVLAAIIKVAFFRFHLNLSIILEVIASKIETADVRAAKSTITKNIKPINSPKLPRELNTFGNVIR
mgnify:CR=1 FL=1